MKVFNITEDEMFLFILFEVLITTTDKLLFIVTFDLKKVSGLLIIMPVKDSISITLRAISFVLNAKGDNDFIVYNDRSLPENRQLLCQNSANHYEVIHLEDIITTPSPNYRYILMDARKKALEKNAHLVIVESDVWIQSDTISELYRYSQMLGNPGLIAAITTNEQGLINFPYTFLKPTEADYVITRHRLSFCCTLLSNQLLVTIDIKQLPLSKDWFDVTISKKSREMGLINYLLPRTKVIHHPHSSRPWKKEKYLNPVGYYLKKILFRRDRI